MDGRDLRFITERRGGLLKDVDHRLLAVLAADCAQHVLHFFEQERPDDDRPRFAIEMARAWARGQITMTQARSAAFASHAAAREVKKAAGYAARSAGHAVSVAHMADHELGATAYAIKATMQAACIDKKYLMGKLECQWQREQLPDQIKELVLDDQKIRNKKFWSLFDC